VTGKAIYIRGQRVEFVRQQQAACNPEAALCIAFADAGKQPEAGFIRINRKWKRIRVGQADAGYEIRPAEEADAAWIRGLYALFSGAYNASLVRESEEYWAEHIRLANLHVICKNEDVVAYIAFERKNGELWVQEYACHPDFDALQSAIALAAQGEGQAVVPAPVSDDEGEICHEDARLTIRLVKPFLLRSGWVENHDQLLALLENAVFWAADEF